MLNNSWDKNRDQRVPLVTIGMPIFNSAATLRAAINSLLGQSFVDFELIISDNNSSDESSAICEEYAKNDSRIKYIKQLNNIGPYLNFKYVYDRGVGRYFLWAAGDDVRSSDFLEENIRFLESNSDFIASTSPNYFENQNLQRAAIINFAIIGTLEERYLKFFKNCWQSNAIFYSVFRRAALSDCEILGKSFIAADWAINLHLLKYGNINRTEKGLIIFGAKGVSNTANKWNSFRNVSVERLIPFYALSCYVRKLIVNFPRRTRCEIMRIVWGLNITALYYQVYEAIYHLYKHYSSRENPRAQEK